MTIGNYSFGGRVRADSFYAQDQWTQGRMTLQGALRYDHAWSYFPEVQVGPVRFFPDPVVYPHNRGSRAITTSRHAEASRSMSSATGKRPSRGMWADISKPPRTAASSSTPDRSDAW